MSRARPWARGERLIEVCEKDKDVPDELAIMVRDVISKREEQMLRAEEVRHVRRRQAAEESDDDGGDVGLFDGDENALHFEWSPMDTFRGVKEDFLPQQTGATAPPVSMYGSFWQYWDDDILKHIVTENNRYAAAIAANSQGFARRLFDTNIDEILVLFSIWMMLGIIRMPSIKSCFSTSALLKVNIFSKMFSKIRYTDLCRALHFVNSSTRVTTDRLSLFGPLLDHLNKKFQSAYVPRQDICIDDSLTLWKGGVSFRQFIKTKAARFGIKTYELCESVTGYIWSFFIYTGKEHVPTRLLKSTQTVVRLIEPLLNKGYSLFMNNYFMIRMWRRLWIS